MSTAPEHKDVQKRQVAKIVRIADLLAGEYVQQSGWLPNFVKTMDGEEVSRVNIIGGLTDIFPTDIVPYSPIESFSATLDDGSGKMQLRSFEPIIFADSLQVGVPVLVIARPKKYTGELFLVPEIIRKLPDHKWLEVRKKLLLKTRPPASVVGEPQDESEKVSSPKQAIETLSPPKVITQPAPSDDGDEEVEAVDEHKGSKPAENVLDIVDRLDSGEGVLVEEAVAEIKKIRPEIDAQQRILTLLLNGDLFEIRPGRIKVLK